MTDHRPQLCDDIKDGKVLLRDLTKGQLDELLHDWTMDYNPDEPFITAIRHELEDRSDMKPIDRNFFKE